MCYNKIVSSQVAMPLTEESAKAKTPGSQRVIVVHQDREFVDQGQELNFNFIGAGLYAQPLTVVGAIYEPGYSGQYDQDGIIRYFTPELNNGGSYLPNGVVYDQTFRNVYSRKMTSGDRPGQYVITFLLYDTNGVLVQQTINYFHYRWSGPAGRYTWRVDYAHVERLGDVPVLVVHGNFPIGTSVYVFLGKASNGTPRYSYLASSGDGRTLLLYFGYQFFRDIELDLTLHDWQLTRQSYTKVGATVLEAQR